MSLALELQLYLPSRVAWLKPEMPEMLGHVTALKSTSGSQWGLAKILA